jgi:hypothetical protein
VRRKRTKKMTCFAILEVFEKGHFGHFVLYGSFYKIHFILIAFFKKKNLHIIVGPSGDIGWKPETNGASRIYFRKDEELVTVALVPEERKEVNKAFFKKKEKNETIEEEGNQGMNSFHN